MIGRQLPLASDHLELDEPKTIANERHINMTTEESPENRAAYVEALKTERDSVARRPTSSDNKRRLADIDAELDSFSETPAKRTRQTAAKKDAPAKPAAKPVVPPAGAGEGDAGGKDAE